MWTMAAALASSAAAELQEKGLTGDLGLVDMGLLNCFLVMIVDARTVSFHGQISHHGGCDKLA